MRSGDPPGVQPGRRAAARSASLIKLLTAQTAYAAGQPTKVVVAPEGLIIDAQESRIGISPGQELPRDLLVRALLIVSANDAARALAVDIAGGEQQFAELMNQQAAALGLANTHAVNATGLDAEGQYSSANDLTRLAAFLMGNPTFQLTVRRTDATLNGQTFPATNDLLDQVPGRRRREDRAHDAGRVVHRRLGAARRPADHRHRARRAHRGGPRRRRHEPPRLGVHPALIAVVASGA